LKTTPCASASITDFARELIATPAWHDKLHDALDSATVHTPIDYLGALGEAGLDAEVWQTHYWFPLVGEGSLTEYAAGSVLRPVLARLSRDDADRFLAQYAERQRAAQPARLLGGQLAEVLHQRRVFAVGRR